MIANETLINPPFIDNNDSFLSSAIEFTLDQLNADDGDALSFADPLEAKHDLLMELELSASNLESEVANLLFDQEDDIDKIISDFEPILGGSLSTDDDLLLEKATEHMMGQVSASSAQLPLLKKRLSISGYNMTKAVEKSNPMDIVMTKLDASMRRTAQTRSILLSSKSLPGFRKSLSLSQFGMELVRKQLFQGKMQTTGKPSIYMATKAGRRRSLKRRLSSMIVKRRLSQMTIDNKNLKAYSQGVKPALSTALPSFGQTRISPGQPYTFRTLSSSIGSFLQRSKKW